MKILGYLLLFGMIWIVIHDYRKESKIEKQKEIERRVAKEVTSYQMQELEAQREREEMKAEKEDA